jgi:crotonobetainyl-CoA:carnitine CoA-transferase CaiB-like acyl-CoA transferase
MEKRQGPLAGIRVLEMGRLIAAPFCGQILGDLGADVIKVERVGGGDDIRGYGPPFLCDRGGPGAASSFYLTYNRNKRSIAIDFSKPEGAELVRQLAAQSDVFIENYKVGSLRKYGLDEASLRKVREDIIYLSVSGFGQTGPYATRPATDVVIQGMSGLMSVTGEGDGPPTKVGTPVADMFTGLYSTVAVLAALFERVQGKAGGAWANMSLLECGMALMAPGAVWNSLAGQVPERTGNDAHGQGSAPSSLFSCRNGTVLIQAGKDPDFVKLCRVLGRDDLAQDDRFAARTARVKNYGILRPILVDLIGQWDKNDLYSRLVDAGIICGPVNDMAEALADPQVVQSGIEMAANHPDDPSLKLIGSPIRFGMETTPIRRHPPRLGEHSEEVLREVLGFDTDRITALADAGVTQLFRDVATSPKA